MKQKFDPHQMTLSQFLLFLVIGGIAVIWLCFEVSLRLKTPGDGAYKVNSRFALELHLSGSENIYLPDESLLPKGDSRGYNVISYSTSKLTRQKDGYTLGADKNNATLFNIRCDSKSPEGGPPNPVRADRVFHGVDVQVDTYGDIVHIEFVLEGYRYTLYMPHMEDTPTPFDEFLEVLWPITENIILQAG